MTLSLSEAQAVLPVIELGLTVQSGGQVLGPGGDLDTAFADFLRLRVADGDASAATARAYYSHVRAFVAWCAGRQIDAGQATVGDLESYRRSLIDSGYARKTVKEKLGAVDRFYAAMQWRNLRSDNPAHGLKAPKDGTDKAEKVKFLPLPGLQRLLLLPQAATPTGARDRAAMLLMGMHGLRVAEVAGLDLGDLDLTGEAGRVVIRHGKGDKLRTVYLTPKTAATLRAWLALRPTTDSPALLLALHPGKNAAGQRLSVRNLRDRVDHYLTQAGLKAAGVSAHSLRHSFATWARFGGADLQAIGAYLGHARGPTTTVYARIADRMKENPAAYLEKLMDSSIP
jgi:site-specific recombinase XerD